MKPADFLAEKRAALAARWLQALFETYPPETSRFLKREKDQFANPVGHALARGVEAILDHLLRETDMQETLEPLADIIRIKAVQDYSPAEAVDFLFRLKQILREETEGALRENRLTTKEMFEFEARIDALVLQAFNIYMKCREKIYDLRVSQVQKSVFHLLKKANLIVEFPDAETGVDDVEKAK